VVEIRAAGGTAPRGVGDVRVTRKELDASPRQQTAELLSAAPGFFVDHEDGEGLGNDVYLRGFDLEHGSGIEMRVGSVPLNVPTHIHGQGYADVNFVIPEVVRSIRVLEGPYDPRQGDAAIVGSAYFDLGVAERGYQVKTSYGSFGQARVVGVAAPRGADPETFAAFSLRKTDGFGARRAGESAAVNAQYRAELGPADHLRLLAAAHGASAALPGVVRQDDLEAGRIGYYGSYPHFAENQSARSARLLVGAAFDHAVRGGAHFGFEPWVMWTDFRARQNYAGELETSQQDPTRSGLGDLFETKNRESAAGFTGRFRTAQTRLAGVTEIAVEPGVTLRVGHTDQAKSLLAPGDLAAWDTRLDAGLRTIDLGAYFDLSARLSRHFRVSGGPRADLLTQSVDDHLPATLPSGGAPPGSPGGGANRLSGVAAGARATLTYEASAAIAAALSYGDGFRSLDAAHLPAGATVPYSKVRSVELGLRAQDRGRRYRSTLAIFQTWVENELVFAASAGGLETERASTRRGVVSSLLGEPWPWLFASTAVSVTDAVFTTLLPGVAHYVPSVPPLLFRADVTARGVLTRIRETALTARVGVGYTFLSGRHLTDAVTGPATNALNAGAGLRYGAVELSVDGFNVLGLKYADDAEVYVSNWSLRPGQQRASVATHLTAAPPASVLGAVSLYF
jgi:hypothetical protein